MNQLQHPEFSEESPVQNEGILITSPLVEIFKTNVEDLQEAMHLTDKLQRMLPACKINFDLQDTDRILRIEGADIQIDRITSFMTGNGYACILLY